MTCAYKGAHNALQAKANSSGDDGFLTLLRVAGNVLTSAFELSRTCHRMLQRQHGRRKLSELDDHLLKDIGVTRAQAERTGRKWFWQ